MRVTLVLALAGQLVAALPSARIERASSSSSSQKVGYISVSVATVWTNSEKPRPGVDDQALTNPVGIQGWLDSMTEEQFLDLTDSSRTQTQALYGTEVNILSEKDGWYELEVSDQPTQKSTFGYPGWVPVTQVSLDSSYGQLQSKQPFAIVDKVATAPLYRDPSMKVEYLEISYDTRLPVISHEDGLVQVALPSGGSAYLSNKHVTVYKSVSEIPYPTGKELVEVGKFFLGRPYLWGGTSGFAFDCSGYTHTLYHARGVMIGRDADAQADFTGHGDNVERSDLKLGDLIYYANNLTDPSTIYHVAMYAGDDKMLEASGAGVKLRLTPVRDDENYWGAQRFLDE